MPFMRQIGKKYCRAGRATGGSLVHARCMPDT